MTVPSAQPFFISKEIATAVFDWKSAIAALQSAYTQPQVDAATPPRSIAKSDHAWLRCLPAVPPGGKYFGAKLMGMGTKSTDPGVEYVVVLYNAETSRIAGFVDAEKVTGYRTAATSAAALDKMLGPHPRKLAVLGSGLEAHMHALAFGAIRHFDEIMVFSPTPAKREALAAQLSSALKMRAVAADTPESAVADADVVLTAARSHGEKPILFADWIKCGAVTVSIGSTVPDQREIDVSVVAQSDLIICDMVHEVVEETGDMIAARSAGIDVTGKCHSINALLGGQLSTQLAAARYPMFKSVGGGLQDVVVAAMLLDRAIDAGLAIPLPIEFATKRV